MRKVFDLHNDCVTACGGTVGGDGVTVLHAIWTTELTVSEVLQAKRRCEAAGVLFSFEDCGLLASDEWGVLDGAHSVGICWNTDNAYAGGALGQGRLTRKGRALIRYCEDRGIAVDLAHLNRPSFWDAIGACTVPPFVSHTGLESLYAHPRNLTVAQIRALIGQGGVVGLSAVADFYGAEDGLTRAIDTYCEMYGSASLCIGTDFWGTQRYTDGLDANNYEKLVKAVEKLCKMGYNDTVIDAILSANAEAYFARVAIHRTKEDV